MEFRFRKAEEADLPVIMELMQEAKNGVPDSEWFEADGMDVVKRHICDEGFVLLAEYAGEDVDKSAKECEASVEDESLEDGRMAGFLIVRFPGKQEDNLGEYLKLSKEEMMHVAHLETAVVSSDFRGKQLQYRLFREAEKVLRETESRYLMATVHPENIFSLRNMEKLGMKKAVEVRKYGGKLRNVMWKMKAR